MRSHQYSLGGYYTGIKGWEFSVEGYYKDMYNVLEYKEGVSFFGSSSGWENKERRDGCPTLCPKVIVSLPKAVSTMVNGSHINMTEDTIST